MLLLELQLKNKVDVIGNYLSFFYQIAQGLVVHVLIHVLKFLAVTYHCYLFVFLK